MLYSMYDSHCKERTFLRYVRFQENPIATIFENQLNEQLRYPILHQAIEISFK